MESKMEAAVCDSFELLNRNKDTVVICEGEKDPSSWQTLGDPVAPWSKYMKIMHDNQCLTSAASAPGTDCEDTDSTEEPMHDSQKLADIHDLGLQEDLADQIAGGESEEVDFMELDDILALENPGNGAKVCWPSEFRETDNQIIPLEDPETSSPRADIAAGAMPRQSFAALAVRGELDPLHKELLEVTRDLVQLQARAALKVAELELVVPTDAQRKVFDPHRQKLLVVLDELNDGFSCGDFQGKLHQLVLAERRRQNMPHAPHFNGYVEGRQELVGTVQRRVLPKHGYEPSALGVHSLFLALTPYTGDDHVLQKLDTTDELLQLPPDATLKQIYFTVEKLMPGTRK